MAAQVQMIHQLPEPTMQIEQEQYDKIAALIHSDTSPVGIDAKKTHILILQLLMDINQRLEKIERQVSAE